MKKYGIVIAVIIVVCVVGALWLDPTGVLMGYLKGEPFFDGRPTGYWERSLRADPATRVSAIERMEQCGEEGVDVLKSLLNSANGVSAEVRWTAAEILGKIGPDAERAGSALLAALEDPDPHVRAIAAASLAKVGVPADEAVPALTRMLETDQKVVAGRALSEYRGAAKSALPALVAVLIDKSLDSETRWNAARTLGKLGPDGVEAIPVLVDSLKDDAATVREHAAEALGDIGPAAADTVPALVAVLDDPATRVRRDAVRSLGQIGEASRPTIADMKKLLKDPEEIVREAAKNAIRAIAPEELPKAKASEKKADGKPKP